MDRDKRSRDGSLFRLSVRICAPSVAEWICCYPCPSVPHRWLKIFVFNPNSYRTIAAAMDDLGRALSAAWRALWPRLRAEPDELRRRLARSDSALLAQPPRA